MYITPKEIINGARGLVQAAVTPESEMSRRRMNICLSCDVLDKNTGVCQKHKGGCGCYIPAKVKLKQEFCPLGKWSKEI